MNGKEKKSELKGNIGLSSKAKLGTGLIGYHQGEKGRGEKTEKNIGEGTHINEKKS